MTPPFSTQLIPTGKTVLVYGAPGGNSSPIQITNMDSANAIWMGNASNIGVNNQSVELTAGSSMSFDGSVSIYATAATAPVIISIVPGGISYSPGSLTITGPVTAEISGPVTVEGTVSIGNTPSVSISGTPDVNISGTPTVNLASGTTVDISGTPTVNLSAGTTVDLASGTTVNIGNTPSVSISGTPTVDIGGTADVNIQNASIDVAGVGGYILPGQLTQLFTNSAAVTATAGSIGTRGAFNVANYSSIILSLTAPSNSSTATGAAVCALWQLFWADVNGNQITQTDTLSCLMGSTVVIQIPVKGSQLTLQLVNVGTVGTLTYAINNVVLWGDYRSITEETVLEYLPGTLPTITGYTVEQSPNPVYTVPKWVASVLQSSQVASTSYMWPLPLYSGPVAGMYGQITQALTRFATIVDLTYATQGNIITGTSYPNGLLFSMNSAAGTLASVSYYSPPTQLAFLYETGATAGGQTTLNLTGG